MAAHAAAANGASVVLLEKHAAIGLPVCCAEGITTFGLERVVEPKSEWIANVIEGATIVGPDSRSVTVYHPKAGYILDREIFDNGLAEMAADVGVDIIKSAPVVGLEKRETIQAVIVDINGARIRVEGRIFIAADGVESRVAHMAGIDTTVSLQNIDSACQYLVDNIKIDRELITIFIGNEIAPGGYAWVFPKSAERANVGVSICPARSGGQNARGYLDKFMARQFPESRILKTMVGGVPKFNRSMPLTVGNLMVVGDAARLVDSLTGAGISNALLSGKIAGEVAAGYIRGEADLPEYPRRFMQLKSRELNAYSMCGSIFVRADDGDFCRILEALDSFFPERKVREVNVPDIILRLVFRNPDLLKMARHLIAR
ncbi:MAG: hypothetical protein A2W25_06625 [candidate division Zixibacteria bacterium RBG_16_53_22]|nr:MAG: hypothetical protein A2W25_06625 [candidate division Zixibacteria bacterium RBG_16_53_22]